jgi:hypothetical protein
VISDRAWRILTASLAFGGICLTVAYGMKSVLPVRFWSFRLRGSREKLAHEQKTMVARSGIGVRLLDTKQNVLPIAMIPRDAFSGFWKLLHVDASDWNQFHLDRRDGIRLPVAPKFPLLSELADIEIENIDFSADQMDELRAEMNAVQENHAERLENDVLLTLSDAARMASAQNKGLTLSPFG